jgi:hypothetical protein
MIKETNTQRLSEKEPDPAKIGDLPKVINYETFESSSEDEFS